MREITRYQADGKTIDTSFASQGKLLVEIPDGPLESAGDSITQGPEFVHLIRAKDTRLRALSELVA